MQNQITEKEMRLPEYEGFWMDFIPEPFNKKRPLGKKAKKQAS